MCVFICLYVLCQLGVCCTAQTTQSGINAKFNGPHCHGSVKIKEEKNTFLTHENSEKIKIISIRSFPFWFGRPEQFEKSDYLFKMMYFSCWKGINVSIWNVYIYYVELIRWRMNKMLLGKINLDINRLINRMCVSMTST